MTAASPTSERTRGARKEPVNSESVIKQQTESSDKQHPIGFSNEVQQNTTRGFSWSLGNDVGNEGKPFPRVQASLIRIINDRLAAQVITNLFRP